MSKRYSRFVPSRLVVPGLTFGAVLALALAQTVAAPPALAGQVKALQPAEDVDLPEGSQIPAWRLKETEAKIKELKQQLRQAAPAQQQQEQAPQTEAPAPKDQSPE